MEAEEVEVATEVKVTIHIVEEAEDKRLLLEIKI